MSVSASFIEYVQSLKFPVSKEKLVNQAKLIEASSDIIQDIDRLPEQEYESIQQLWDSIIKYK